jgi:hypothetical protein
MAVIRVTVTAVFVAVLVVTVVGVAATVKG